VTKLRQPIGAEPHARWIKSRWAALTRAR